MTPKPLPSLIAVIDIGTHKTASLLGQVIDGKARMLSFSERRTDGVVKGTVTDLEKLTQCVHEVVNDIERGSGRAVEQVYLSLSGPAAEGERVKGFIAVPAHDGKVTAIDILRTAAEKALQEKIRLAIDDAVRAATPAPALVNGGQPFRSRWLFAATWFIDPPGCLLTPSDAMGATPGQFGMGCGGTFDVTSEGVKTSSFDVQQKVTAELLRIIPLQR